MNKLKSTFSLRHHKDTTPEKRSQTFIKKLSLQKDTSISPQIDLDDLSSIESDAYLGWWKDLDPFGIGKADNKAIFQFISGSNLPSKTLEEILALFKQEKDGLNRQQFFAMLRLIAHAQHGRAIQRDLVYLGAPVPRFQTQAIEALIHPSNDIVPSWMITVPPEQVGQTKLSQPQYPQGNHSRSRSVPYGSTTESLTPVKRHSGHASLNHDSIQNMMMNQPLLLTQGFRPNFDDEDDDDNDNDNDNENPFKSKESLVLVNTKSNADHIPPPPVPSQHSKPAFPKYARRL